MEGRQSKKSRKKQYVTPRVEKITLEKAAKIFRTSVCYIITDY